jgi:hypothetical protein
MPRICLICEGRGLLRHNTTTADGKYLFGFIPCVCAKGKRIAAERAKNTEQQVQPDTTQVKKMFD